MLPRAFAEQALALRTAMAGPQPSRVERATAVTQSAMRDALGWMYAERYFPAGQKARVERISDNVRAALMKRVEAATWMSPATKASALSKLKTLYVGTGYPDRWEDYSSLTVDPDYVRQQDRAFFLAYAQTQRRKTTEGATRKQVATDNHAPEDYRAATVRNLDAWYEAFDVRAGQRLYLEPAARVRIW